MSTPDIIHSLLSKSDFSVGIFSLPISSIITSFEAILDANSQPAEHLTFCTICAASATCAFLRIIGVLIGVDGVCSINKVS